MNEHFQLTFDSFSYLISVPNVAIAAAWIFRSSQVTNDCNSSQ